MFSSTAAMDSGQPATWLDIPDHQTLGSRFAELVSRTADQFSKSGEGLLSKTTYCTDLSDMAQLADEGSEQEINVLLEQIHDCCQPELANGIVSRLRFLRDVLQEEQGPDVDVSPESLRGLLLFVLRLGRVRLPEISLTPEYDIYLRWKQDTSRLFAVHFLGHRMVRFAAFAPNPRHFGIVDRLSGTATVDTVLETADRSCFVLEWMRE